MKNKLNFYVQLISSILDSCCSYIVTVENSDIKLISFYGNKPFDLDTLKLLLNNFDPTKKSFSIIDVKDFKTTIKNDNFRSKNINSIGYLPILDENKITIGYLIISFNKPNNFSKNQEKTITLLSNKISEKLQKNRSITTKDLNSSESPDFKLNLTKEILKKTFKFSNDVFCIVNKDHEFEFVSNTSFNVWGFTPEEMIGNSFKNYIIEEDILESIEKEHQLRNNSEELSSFVNRYLHKDGSIKSMSWSAHWDEESELLYCIGKDVTDFKEIIKKSNENKNLLLEAQQLARMGSWNFDLKDDKLSWSDGLYIIFDLNKEHFLETYGSFIDFIILEDRDFVLQTSKNTRETGEPFNIEYRIRTPSGEQRFIEEFGYSEKDATGKIIRLFGTAQDITERKKNELLLQDSNNKYKYLFDNNPSPLFIFDFETLDIIDCNIESLMLYGYSREEFLQLTIKDIRPEEDISLILETTENESAYGKIHKKVWRHLKKNGDLMYVEITAHLLDYNDRRSSLVLINDITAKIELEKKQKEHVQFIETTLENLPIGIAVNKIDDGSATLMNEQFSEIYGWPKQDLTNVATFFEKVYPDVEYREKIVNQVVRDMLSKDPEKMTWEGITITTQDGTKRIINAKQIPIYDQNLMISMVVDVTEKFTIQRNLQQSNERYHYASLATSDALWDWDYDNNLMYRAEGFKTVFGFDMEELNLPNTNWENYIHPDDRQSVTKRINEMINSSGNYWKHDYRIIKPNGQIAFVQDSAYIIRGENNNIIRIIGALQDITQRKKAEEKFSKAADALQKALNDTNKIMDSSLDLICVVNKQGYFVKVSAACEAILGYKPEELIGKLLINYVYNIDTEKTQMTADVVMSGKSIKHFENRYTRKDGSLVSLEWAARYDENDKLRYGVARDITERKTYEEQLVKLNKDLNKQRAELITSNKELEQFAYVASHDLQEPLRMVTSFLTLLEKRYNDVLDEKGLKYINFAVEGAKSMRQIILDILEFSRIDNNEENYELIDLNDIIKEISLLQGKLIKEKKAKIICDELPELYSVRHYLMQLFQNIISNALKYSKEDVPLKIKIKSKEYKNHYQIAINDNGIGIEEEYYEKIFIIFQRLHGKEKYEGNGMGLAIAKKIVDKLNGTIWVKSKAGIGSTFYINIPK